MPTFFLSQISLHKSLKHEQRTDERRKLISAVPCSLCCIHTANITCTPRYKGIQGHLSRFAFSLKLLNVSPLHICFCCSGFVHERAVSCSELSKMLIKREGNLLLELLSPGKGFVQNHIPLLTTASVQRIFSILNILPECSPSLAEKSAGAPRAGASAFRGSMTWNYKPWGPWMVRHSSVKQDLTHFYMLTSRHFKGLCFQKTLNSPI